MIALHPPTLFEGTPFGGPTPPRHDTSAPFHFVSCHHSTRNSTEEVH